MPNYHILMADIIKSKEKKPDKLIINFKNLTSDINLQYKTSFLSPSTITLGDEFQAIVRSLKNSVEVIIAFEEKIIQEKQDFKLRYVLHYGTIDTPINKNFAYGMLGPGLTEARNRLEILKNQGHRFFFSLGNKLLEDKMNFAFILYQSFVDSWKVDNFPLVAEFLKDEDYKKVAKKLKKDTSLMWKRKKTLKINEYIAAKNMILLLAEST